MLIIPIGISGSGKSHYGKYIESVFPFEIICPDNIRKELTGSISDQSKNKEVFETSHIRILKALEENKNVYFSATNVGYDNLCNFLNLIESKQPLIRILLFFMVDSLLPGLCFERIQKQLDDGEERSEIRDIYILQRQFNGFENVRNNVASILQKFPKTEMWQIRDERDVKYAIRHAIGHSDENGFDSQFS